MHDDFGIGVRMEAMTARFEAQAQLLKVINLTIEHEPNHSVFIGHRLASSSRCVDDGKSIVGERDVLRNYWWSKATGIKTVWAAMANRAGHPLDRTLELGEVE